MDVAEPSAAPEGTPWHDLAGNRPGELLRNEAEEIKARTPPVKRFLARALFVHTDERAFRRGAEGEEAVAARLRKLPDGWEVLHSVPVGKDDSDIDHVVIGPAGVFTINTKNHGGKKVWIHTNVFKVSGFSQPYLRNSRHEATRARRLLSAACGFPVEVDPVIVVIADDVVVKGLPDDVLISTPRRLVRKLVDQPVRLDEAQVAAIYEQARISTTWR